MQHLVPLHVGLVAERLGAHVAAECAGLLAHAPHLSDCQEGGGKEGKNKGRERGQSWQEILGLTTAPVPQNHPEKQCTQRPA